jgi:hypothetical protein
METLWRRGAGLDLAVEAGVAPVGGTWISPLGVTRSGGCCEHGSAQHLFDVHRDLPGSAFVKVRAVACVELTMQTTQLADAHATRFGSGRFEV